MTINTRRDRRVFSWLFIFHRFHRTIADTSRPVDKRRRNAYYSGKKKKHTIKTQLMVNSHGFIIHKANHHKKGKRHDYDIYKINHPVTPKVVVNMFDLGYLGIQKDFPAEQLSSLPDRKQRNLDLSQEEKKRKQNSF